VLVSFVYVVACRLFALVLLFGRSEGSKELEIVLLRHELARGVRKVCHSHRLASLTRRCSR
jgi:hypothetical protein